MRYRIPLGSLPASRRPSRSNANAVTCAWPGLVVDIAAARSRHPINFPLLPGGDVKRAVRRERQCPDVALAGRKVFRSASVLDAVHLAVRRRARVHHARAIHRDREDLGLIGIPHHRAVARRIQFEKPPAVARSEIERAIRRRSDAPDLRLIGRKNGVDFGADDQPSVGRDRKTAHASAQEILIAVDLPSGGSGARRERGASRAQQHAR